MDNKNLINNQSNSTSSEQNLFHGLSFLADNSFGESLDNCSPFKPEISLTPFRTPKNCLQLIPRLISSNINLQSQSTSSNSQLLTPRHIRPTSNLNSSINSSISSLNTPLNTKQKEKIPTAKTPLPQKRAVRVIKRLLYEERPTYYLVAFEQKFSNRTITLNKWILKNKSKPYIVKMIEEFEQKLSKNKKLANDLTEYEVESILDKTLSDDVYLVKWVGWKEPTWEKRHYLVPKYQSLLSEFDLHNNQPLPVGGKGIIINNSKRVVEAISVLAKLDRGNSGQANSYLLEWPSNSFRIYNEGNDNIQTWEDKMTLGNVRAIEEFECKLKKGVKSAKEVVQYEVERIENKRCKSKEIEYSVKFKGCERRSWINRNELLKSCQNLIKQYEIDRLKNEKKARN